MKIIRIILLILNILAALGLIATTLAGVISPSKNIMPSVLAYGFLPMLGINLLFFRGRVKEVLLLVRRGK